MGFTIQFNNQHRRIEVIHRGTLTTQVLAQSVPEVQIACTKFNCWRILSDIRQCQYRVSDTEEMAVAQHLTEAYPAESRLVIICLESQIPLERIRLLQQVTQLHGLQLCFTTEETEVESLFNLDSDTTDYLVKSPASHPSE